MSTNANAKPIENNLHCLGQDVEPQQQTAHHGEPDGRKGGAGDREGGHSGRPPLISRAHPEHHREQHQRQHVVRDGCRCEEHSELAAALAVRREHLRGRANAGGCQGHTDGDRTGHRGVERGAREGKGEGDGHHSADAGGQKCGKKYIFELLRVDLDSSVEHKEGEAEVPSEGEGVGERDEVEEWGSEDCTN